MGKMGCAGHHALEIVSLVETLAVGEAVVGDSELAAVPPPEPEGGRSLRDAVRVRVLTLTHSTQRESRSLKRRCGGAGRWCSRACWLREGRTPSKWGAPRVHLDLHDASTDRTRADGPPIAGVARTS